jgi:hypothetical protein
MSNQERVSWVSLLVSVIVGGLYFRHVLGLPAGADLRFQGFYVTNLIIMAIFIGIAGEAVLRWIQRRSGEPGDDKERPDERDALIGLRATRNAHVVLTAAVIGVLAQTLFTEAGWWRATRAATGAAQPMTVLDAALVGPMTPMLVAQLLLAALTLAGLTVYASRIFYYRRGF